MKNKLHLEQSNYASRSNSINGGVLSVAGGDGRYPEVAVNGIDSTIR